MPQQVDTLIFNDVHLRSRVCRADALLVMLDDFVCNRIVLNGDIFDDLKFHKLPRSHTKVVARIESLSKACEVVWVQGNHDKEYIGIPEYFWEYNREKYLAIHGDSFDDIHKQNPLLANFGDIVYRAAQVILTHERPLARNIKARNKRWLQASQIIARGAAEYAHTVGAKYVFCGHTHRAMHSSFPDLGVEYYNSGCWTDIPSTCITVSKQGIEIHEYRS
ncbi:MAG: hypothetical protein G01um101448_1082 [Parcubacteria group bacterium Gr01-1014_48]|nr:MAG: hypothetical protein Greene041614_263 [Parcubacteria group bacterium Greene0416_14]TSC71845.1 MAG: hypothetical protein G01um101448_1082 [Parcubacteria group bacterium Gr01-1014_48]TSC99869.1 MAG: hypothetical protein Greene101415_1057 [Parcubacteria group bacterium Greene1014_15]TSD06686.1 MAG: hypothetical protein Greene07144_1126 [Parcubacteria group bacterium Greene0714_4]